MQKLVIEGRLPSLNEYTNKNRSNRYEAAKMKRECEEQIGWSIKAQRIEPVSSRADLTYVFFEKNRRRDKDNISGVAHKFINDALVKCGILEDDSWEYVGELKDRFEVDKYNPRIEVYIDDSRTDKS